MAAAGIKSEKTLGYPLTKEEDAGIVYVLEEAESYSAPGNKRRSAPEKIRRISMDVSKMPTMDSVARFKAAMESDKGALGPFMISTDPAFV